MIPAMLTKVLIKQVMKAIEKASDKRIASDHEKRIKKLEDNCKCNKKTKNKSRRK